MNKKQLRKAIDIISLKYTEGVVSIDILEKACNNYKQAIGFKEDFDYELIVAKSVIDSINGIETDKELQKAIVPGQTKVVDGVTYIYSATKQGSKVAYDWHVVTTNQHNLATGRGISLTDAQKKSKQQYINDLFPKDLSSLKVIKTLGGSTGAVLVEDVNGNRYVMKKGINTNDAHVRSEYLSNQLYDMLGVRVPDYELYSENGTNILLSRFIPGLTAVNKYSGQKDRIDLARHAMVDVLLNNWDVYENDNTNRDSAGRIIRVDNGGCLGFRAKGGSKPFTDDVVKSYDDMVRYNQAIFGELSDDDIIAQIEDIQKKKSHIVNFLRLSGDDKLADLMGRRIDSLKKIVDRIKFKKAQASRQILPRHLLPAAQMYRSFTDDEIQDFFDNAQGSSGVKKVEYVGSNGWDLIHTICEERGFTARPRVVSDKEYWDEIAKGRIQCFRGVHDAGGSCTAQYQIDHFKYNDDFYIGQAGIYGGGLYAHVNDGDKFGGKTDRSRGGYRASTAYSHAKDGYGTGSDDSVMLFALEDDIKLVEYSALKAELKKEAAALASVSPADKAKVDKIKKKIETLTKEIDKLTDDLTHIGDKTKKAVMSSMSYDEGAVTELFSEIDDVIDWGALDANGDYQFPKYKEFVLGKIVNWVKANGGTVTEDKGQVTLKMPHSRITFTIMQHQWDMPSIIRRRNPFSPHYHNYARKFENWFTANHVQIVQDKIRTEMDNLSDKVTKLKDEISEKQKERIDSCDEVRKLETNDREPDKLMLHAIEESLGGYNSDTALGVFAAIKGYDGIYIPNGNHCRNGFVSILNRSKIIVKQ